MDNFEEPLTTTAMEAMHFRRGLHYLRYTTTSTTGILSFLFSVKAAELIVPIPELEDGSPDWRVVQQVELQLSFIFQLNANQVWWDMHDVVARFEAEDKYPVDLAVEDRSIRFL